MMTRINNARGTGEMTGGMTEGMTEETRGGTRGGMIGGIRKTGGTTDDVDK